MHNTHPDYFVETTVHHRPKTSDVIDQLDGLRDWRHHYLCNYLADQGRTIFGYTAASDAESAIGDFVHSQSGEVHTRIYDAYRSYTALAELWKLYRIEDNNLYSENTTAVRDRQFLEARDKFCRDYAAFLREFGL